MTWFGRDAAAALAAILIATLAAAASVIAAPGLGGALGAALAVLVVLIAAIDMRRFIIPDELTAATFGLGLISAATQEMPGGWPAIADALMRAAALAACFLAVRIGYRLWRGRTGLGLGDVKLAGAAGAWLGWTMMPVAVEIAALAALAVYLVRHIATGAPLRATARLPFGLFLAPAIWSCWLLQTVLLGR